MRKARDAGVGLALVRATTHTAALGYYTLAPARGAWPRSRSPARPHMAYHGAPRRRRLDQPDLHCGPRREPRPGGARHGDGHRLPGQARAGAAAASRSPKDGRSTTRDADHRPAAAEIPLPMAGPKGSGLALMIELLTSCSSRIRSSPSGGQPAKGRHRQNGLALAMDLALRRPGGVRREVDRADRGAESPAGRSGRRDPHARRARRRAFESGAAATEFPLFRPIVDELRAVGRPLRRRAVPVSALAPPGSGR